MDVGRSKQVDIVVQFQFSLTLILSVKQKYAPCRCISNVLYQYFDVPSFFIQQIFFECILHYSVLSGTYIAELDFPSSLQHLVQQIKTVPCICKPQLLIGVKLLCVGGGGGTHGGQRTWDSLELELQPVVICPMWVPQAEPESSARVLCICS